MSSFLRRLSCPSWHPASFLDGTEMNLEVIPPMFIVRLGSLSAVQGKTKNKREKKTVHLFYKNGGCTQPIYIYTRTLYIKCVWKKPTGFINFVDKQWMCMWTPNQDLTYLVHEISGVLHEFEVYLPKLIFLVVGKNVKRQNVSLVHIWNFIYPTYTIDEKMHPILCSAKSE